MSLEVQNKACGQCQQPVLHDAPEGLCPACLLERSLFSFREATPKMRDVPLPSIPNYESFEFIGQGGMGVVYKARQKSPERTVALKLILAGSLASQKEIRRFHAEAQAVARLRHPNIVTIYEVGEHQGQHFFSMEHIEGVSLSDKIESHSLSFSESATLVKKVAEAVQCAHEHGVLHRDLKPANILMDKRGEPHITDFGLAQQREAPSDLTRSGTILGTPSFMPPEQAEGRTREISPASDVYAIGAILYQALTGRPPFQAESLLETLRQVVTLPPAAPRLLNPKVPRDLEVICLKCLRKEPSQRYPSAEALAEDLHRFLHKQPIQARPMGIIERNIAWCIRNPIPAGAIAGSTFLLTLLAIAAILFRVDSIHRNTASARIAARVLQNYLRDMSQPLLAVSASQEFADSLAAGRTNQLISLLQAKGNVVSTDPRFSQIFQNWIVLAPDGDLVVRVPPRGSFTNRAMRDYYNGATNLFTNQATARAHFSKVYKSRDDTFYKIGLTAPVIHSNQLTGILGMMLKTFSTELEPLGLWDERQKTVVLARWDPSSTAAGQKPFQWVIWLHPKFSKGADAIAIPGDIRFNNGLRYAPYFDPAGKTFPEYRGPWVAGFAPVADTPFLVVVQSRDWVGLSVIGTLLVVSAACAFFLVLKVCRRRFYS